MYCLLQAYIASRTGKIREAIHILSIGIRTHANFILQADALSAFVLVAICGLCYRHLNGTV